MHQTSLDNMRLCYARYIAHTPLERRANAIVLDVGAMDINGSYREVFRQPNFEYVGVDIAPGAGVDIVMQDPHRIPFDDASVDIVVCGQMFEHCEFFWLVFAEMVRVLKLDGFLFLIAPSAGPYHPVPVDCYRFYPDSYRALARYADCRLIDLWWEQPSEWRDLVGVFQRHSEAHVGRRTPADAVVFDQTGKASAATIHAGKRRVRPLALGFLRLVRRAMRVRPGHRNPLFDAAWYLARYEDVRTAGVDPYSHFVEHGWREGRNPSPTFDTGWYLSENPDVRASGMNALDHYHRHGRAEGRPPAAWHQADAPSANESASAELRTSPQNKAPGSRHHSAVGISAGQHGRVLLHVGTHKTGTTAFQSYIAEWRMRLLNDHGIFVHPGLFGRSHFEVSALVIRPDLTIPDRWLLRGHGASALDNEIRSAIRRTVEHEAQAVLFSAEGLCFLRTDDEVAEIRQLFWPRRVEPIVVLRDPREYLRAYRSTIEAMGFSGPSVDPESAAYVEADSWLVNYQALLRALDQLADGGPVRVINYEREMESAGSIIPALGEAIGLDRARLYPGFDRQMNVTASRRPPSAPFSGPSAAPGPGSS